MKRLMLLAVMGLVLAGCGGQEAADGQPQGAQTGGEAAQEMVEMGKAMEAGKPVECTMTDQEGGVVKYQVYKEKMRIEGMEYEGSSGSMINDGKFAYYWQEGATEGLKVDLTDEGQEVGDESGDELTEEVPDFESEEDMQEYEDLGYQIDCNNWKVDESRFVPPANVNFVDMSAMTENIRTNLEDEGFDPSKLDPELQQQLEGMMEQESE